VRGSLTVATTEVEDHAPLDRLLEEQIGRQARPLLQSRVSCERVTHVDTQNFRGSVRGPILGH
jgi:hypothetical protein